jgi:chromosomal replication initiator protein
LAYEHVFNDIIDICAKHFGTTREMVLSPIRQTREVRARQSAMFIARRLTGRSYPEIGRRFGGRDHTTVLHADRKISALIEDEPTWQWTIERLTERALRVARARLAEAGAGRISG